MMLREIRAARIPTDTHGHLVMQLHDLTARYSVAYRWLRRRWLRRVAWLWVSLIAASVAALVLFAKIGEDVFEHESTAFDGAIRGWALAHQYPAVFDLFLAVTWLGSTVVLIPCTAACAMWLWRRTGRRTAAAVVTAPAIATGIFILIKHFFRRIRPSGAARLHELTYAFPSGHATTAAAVLATIAYVLWRERVLTGRRALLLGTVGPLLIGASRIYLDVHWTTDVLGGWSAGLLVAILCATLYEYLRLGKADVSPFATN